MKLTSLNLNRFIKFILFSISICFFVFLTSCDPGVDYSRIVQNDSDFDVKVLQRYGYWQINGQDTIFSRFWYLEGSDTIFVKVDTLTIEKHSSKTIYTAGGIGSVSDYENCYNIIYYDIIPVQIHLKDSLLFIPNINELSGWNYRITKKQKNGGGVCECRIILTNQIITELQKIN